MKSVAVSFIMTLVMVSNNSFYLILSTCNKRCSGFMFSTLKNQVLTLSQGTLFWS